MSKLPTGYYVSRSCVVPGLLQGWFGEHPVTGSYDTEEEVVGACLKDWERRVAAFEKRKAKVSSA